LLKAGVLLVVQMSVGGLFQVMGPATPNAHWQNISDTCGMNKPLLWAE